MVADCRAAGPIETKQRKYRSVLIGHGWCDEVHRLAEASLYLVDHGYGHEALILLRTMFETTISLHWLSQKGDAGALGVFTEGSRLNRAAAEDMQKGFNVPKAAQAVPALDREGTWAGSGPASGELVKSAAGRNGADVVRTPPTGLDNKEPPGHWPGGFAWSG
ncbi:DUF5677 domain-containing protein [Streptomyces fuscus]|uniref:DUF5677 domain-containing protein n=1 Tax=Streptomyces fuscus TaxID=3048495 RepID=UPI003B00D7EB